MNILHNTRFRIWVFLQKMDNSISCFLQKNTIIALIKHSPLKLSISDVKKHEIIRFS